MRRPGNASMAHISPFLRQSRGHHSFNPRHFALGHLDQNLALPPFNFIQRPSGFINRNAKKYTHLDTNHFQSKKICKEGLTLQFNNRSLAQVAGQTMEAHYNA